MASYESSYSQDYEECYSIKKIVAKERFPILVCTYTTSNFVHAEDRCGIPEDTELLLQGHFKARYALINVLKIHDKEETEIEKGAEFVTKHNSYAGKEFLIPLKYPGVFKFVKRPGSRVQYSSIAQVLSDPPVKLRVSEDTEAMVAKNLDKKIIIPEGTMLEPRRKFRLGTETKPFLECWDGSSSYAFRENDSVHFTAVENPSVHNMFELSKIQLLPKVIGFQHINQQDIALKDEVLSDALIAILEGPVEVKGFTDEEFIVCLAKNHGLETYENVYLIPNTLWNTIYVQREQFLDETVKEKYVTKHFKKHLDLDYIDKALYLIYAYRNEVIWLRGPDCLNLKEVLGLDPSGKSEEKHDVTDDRSDVQLPSSKIGNKKGLVQMIKDKVRHGISQLHVSIPKTSKRKKRDQAIRPKADHYDTIEVCDYEHVQTGILSQGQDVNLADYTRLFWPKQTDLADKCDNLADNREYSVLQLSEKMESSDEFYTYTHAQLVSCFEQCGMGKFANKCNLKKLDGAFFRNFDLNELKFEPFLLTEDELVMVRKIIEEGFRHKLKTN